MKTGLRSYPDDISQNIIYRSDVLFLSALVGAESAAFYTIALVATELLLILSEAGTTATTRRLLAGGDTADDNTSVFIRYTFYLVTPAAVVLSLSAGILISLVFGDSFQPAATAVPWLAPGVVALSMAGYARLALIGRGHGGIVSAVNLSCAAVNLILNAILIPKFGLIGAAIASSISYIAIAVAHLIHWSIRSEKSLLSLIWAPTTDLATLKRTYQWLRDHMLSKHFGDDFRQ